MTSDLQDIPDDQLLRQENADLRAKLAEAQSLIESARADDSTDTDARIWTDRQFKWLSSVRKAQKQPAAPQPACDKYREALIDHDARIAELERKVDKLTERADGAASCLHAIEMSGYRRRLDALEQWRKEQEAKP